MPDWTLLACLAFGLAFFCLVLFLIAHLGGWATLASQFRADKRPTGTSYHLQSGFIGSVNYGGCLTVIVSDAGLYVQVFPLFRIGHAPLLIPWQDLTAAEERRIFRFPWFQNCVQLDVGQPPIASLLLPAHIFRQLPQLEHQDAE